MTTFFLFQWDYFPWNNTRFVNIKLQFRICDLCKVWCVGIQIYLHPSLFPSILGRKYYWIGKCVVNEEWLGFKKVTLMQRWFKWRIDYVYIYWLKTVKYFVIIFFNTLSSNIEIRKVQPVFSHREWRNSNCKSWN